MKYTLGILCLLFCGQLSWAQLYVNEIMAANDATIADNAGEYEDWIEIYNAGSTILNLQDYYISDDPLDPLKHQISGPIIIPAGGYVLLWADEDIEQGVRHLDFRLRKSGETVVLTANDGVTIVDQITYTELEDDFSFGRQTDGSSDLLVFEISSPDASNATGSANLLTPVISPPTGIYTSNQTVTISAGPGTTIYYTTDGSTPSTSSTLYTGSFTINQSQSVRAFAARSGFSDSEVALNSYVFNPTTNLPILHVTIDPMYLWDDQVGMHVIGTNGIPGPCRTTPANYNQDWEYQANATLYETDGSVGFSEGIGLSISGGCSRQADKKSFNVAFKNEYGNSTLEYPLFETREETEYEGFKIRSGGNHRHTYRALDASLQKVIEGQLDVDHQHTRPVALYLNGEYWGLFNIRDRMNKGFVETYYTKNDEDNLDLIELPLASGITHHWLFEEVSQGTNADYHALDAFMTNNSLANASNYDYVNSQIDINSFIDYIVANIYYNNGDWPGNNLKTWKENSPDSRWRWMLFDLDFLLLFNGGASNIGLLEELLDGTRTNSQRNQVSANPIRQLMENNGFEAEFIQRSNTYIETVWDASRTSTILSDFNAVIATEIQSDHDRWPVADQHNNNDESWNLATWNTNVTDIDDYFVDRPDFYRTMIDNTLNKSGRYQLTLNFNNSTNGVVALHSNHFSVPTNYTGTYHDNVPIEIHAIPDPGFRFSHWQETGSTDQTLYVTYNSNQTLTPVFVVAPDLVINEIHYNPLGSSEGPEFIEIYNPDSNPRDISTYEFSEGVCFEFPEGTTIGAGEYIVIANDASIYEGNGYQVFQWYQTALSNNGEHISLENGAGEVIDSLSYNDGGDWIAVPDNGFYSLALLDHTLDNSLPASWDVQSVFLTPGAANQFSPFDTFHAASDIVINEIHYHPLNSIDVNGDTIESRNYEFIELINTTNSTVSLTDVALTRGVTYQFPTGSSIPANGFIVLAEDSLEFINRYGFSPFGEYNGKLSNSGENIWLSDGDGMLLDAVDYDDIAPWETEADGGLVDNSLALIEPSLDNSDYASWCIQPSGTTPGAQNIFGDTDNDTIIDCYDQCPGLDDTLIGTPCDDNDTCTDTSVYTNCNCEAVKNIALNGTAIMSSQFSATLNATNLNDGVISASTSELAHTSTASDQEWVQIDLGANSLILTVAIWNRVGGGTERLSNTYLMVADTPFPLATDIDQSLANADFSYLIGDAFNVDVIGIDVNLTGRYVRIQKTGDNVGNNAINLRELEIFTPLGSLPDADTDGVCDNDDQCPNFDDNLIGTACDDGDPCTIGEAYDNNCGCTGGVSIDSDSDGICDANDQCPNFDDNLIGTACEDGDPCTDGETYDNNCSCTGGVSQDSDNDGICDNLDQCPNFDNQMIGTPCDDGDACTNTSVYSNCNCEGVDNIALDGIASMSSQLNSFITANLNDGVISNLNNDLAHTTNNSNLEWVQIDLNKSTLISTVTIWNRTACCSERLSNTYLLISNTPFPTNVNIDQLIAHANFSYFIGDASNLSTVGVDVNITGRYVRIQKSGDNAGQNAFNLKELEIFAPSTATFDDDNDGVCNALDTCAGSDDTIDINNNGIPDGCEGCADYITESNQGQITIDKSANISIGTNGTVPANQDIEYRAGNSVNLLPLFEVKPGAVFHALISPCQ